MANLGFIGLGIMGKPMAGHLIKAGHTVHLYNRSATSIHELASQGGIPCTSCHEVAMKSDIIFTIVPDTPDVEKVIFGDQGLIHGLKSGSMIIDMSTISPVATKEFAKRLLEKQVEMLDAPVSGGQIGAEQATLSIMVGGSTKSFDRAKPFFELMGKNIVHIGENGAGQICKLANQIVVAVTIEAVSEALVFASKAGVDPAKVREALLGGFAGSKILDLHGKRMIERTFAPGFKVSLQLKDLNLVLHTARSMGMSLPGTALAQELYNAVSGQGNASLDNSALVFALERLANHRIKTST
ncbi:MAG: 2-hydroxy-3-oxopropionate reductase [Nitrospirota bacterium]